MLSPGYFDFRWSWYRPVLNRGETPSIRCKVDVRRLPVQFSGEDAKQCIPYAIHSKLAQTFSISVQRLQDYAVRYMLKGEKVSGHQLPAMDALTREMAKHLRGQYPHLPITLVHHWCADEHGGLALYQTWQKMWRQSWKQDRLDTAPWVPAVNVLILKLIREAIGRLSDEHAAHTDHIMVCMVGGLYDWAVQRFLKEHLDGAVEVTRIATYESMIIPATPIAFLYRQPDDSLLGDDRFVVAAYGLEADLVPRMRALRAKVGPKNEMGILALLARERMGEHFLMRSWARLSLWEMAEKNHQGIWMQWVLDAKKLDQLLSRPELLTANIAKELEGCRDHYPLAAWLLDRRAGGKIAKNAGKPWLQDDRVLMAFRTFEEDVKVEVERRKYERLWLDRRSVLAGKRRGSEIDKLLETAYAAGELIYFQVDTEKSLRSGVSLAVKQGCLRVEWSDYLTALSALKGDHRLFLEKQFLPGVVAIFTGKQGVFLDDCSASGCLVRGAVADLVQGAVTLRDQMCEWYSDLGEEDGRGDKSLPMPAVSNCIALMGDWDFVRHQSKGGERITLAFSLAVAQANAGISRDSGAGRLMDYRDHKSKRRALGGIRVERFDSGAGQTVQLLHNNGIAVTGPAVHELVSVLSHRASIRELRVDPRSAEALLSGYRRSNESLELVHIVLKGSQEKPLLLIKSGRLALAGVDTDLYELLDSDTKAAQLILTKGLASWE